MNLQTQFFQGPAVSLRYILARCRDVRLRDEHSTKPQVQVLLQSDTELASCLNYANG